MKIQENKLKENLNTLLEDFRDYNNDIWELEDKLDTINDNLENEWQWEEDEIEEFKQEKAELEEQLNELKSKQRAEYEKELADLPPETDKRDFEGFRTDETDPRFWSYYIPRK